MKKQTIVAQALCPASALITLPMAAEVVKGTVNYPVQLRRFEGGPL
jgi:hypothetical protein